MKNSLYLALTLILCAGAVNPALFAQNKKGEEPVIEVPEFSIDKKTNQVVYSEVIDQSGSPEKLYGKALEWFDEFYPNAKGVIKEKNPEKGMISGTARFNFNHLKDPKSGVESRAGMMVYDITILLKEGRYKYEITRINKKQASYFGIEKWIEENEKAYHAEYAHFLVQMDDYMQELITSLKDRMQQEPEAEEEW